ncbi:MAG: MBL fold metallo-hydrolase [Bacteroidetes bacterium]|nr:MAG: MBL fold metallo-hydrolase [Bacteroidota bacterium]
MFIKQLYTGCLSEAAYFVESEGEAIVIDPVRDTEVYLQLARERNASIKYIFETHFHADFVSGHIDLGKKTGAKIIYGPDTETNFPVYVAADGEEFKIGKLTIEVLHTPGHTLESTCYLLKDENKKPYCVFTGDTLFVGDVGRPDLAQQGNLTMEKLAGLLYDSIQKKLVVLPDDTIIYPAHGPGSSCGKNLGPETYSTIREEKATNYALKAQTREEFIRAVTDGLTEPPEYFPINARINKEGYESLDKVVAKGLTPFSVKQVKKLLKENEDLIILDTRNAAEFTQGFVPGSVSIGLEGRFAEWAGSLLPFDQDILLVTEPGKEEESIVRLARVGFDKIVGYLEGGFQSWRDVEERFDMIIDIEPSELAMDIPYDDSLVIIDVRKPVEFAEGHVQGAVNIPLNDMKDPGSMAHIDDRQNIYVHCQGGYRSVIASSLLKRQGFNSLRNIMGGWSRIKEETDIPLVKETSILN